MAHLLVEDVILLIIVQSQASEVPGSHRDGCWRNNTTPLVPHATLPSPQSKTPHRAWSELLSNNHCTVMVHQVP